MKVIHKFRLPNDGSDSEIKLKHGYKIVHSEYVVVEKAIYIWVEQTLSVGVRDMEVVFKVVKSGEPLPEKLDHVATVVDSFAPEAYHIFKESASRVAPARLDHLPREREELERKRA